VIPDPRGKDLAGADSPEDGHAWRAHPLKSAKGGAASLVFLRDPPAGVCRPYGTRLCCLELTQDLRPFGFAQGRLWTIVCRPSGAGVRRRSIQFPPLSFPQNLGVFLRGSV
jgi:hypothetical protein